MKYSYFNRQIGFTESCWVWIGKRDKGGYGIYNSNVAHRASYELFVSKIPKGMQIDHLCFERACVNPAHLEAVTQAENILRSIPNRTKRQNPKYCIHGHQYNSKNTYIRPNNSKSCRTCQVIAVKNYKKGLKK